jgi:excinuclease ABC subunit A
VIEMQYLEDIILPCEDCKGVGMKPLYANLSDGHMTVAQAFQRPLGEVLARVELTPKFRRTWEYLKLLNLDYLSLDRPLNSLSGGERQRVFLLSRLLGKLEDALIIFENLSFGLSPREIARLGEFLQQLAQAGHTIVVIDNDPQWGPIAQAEMAFSPDAVILKET